MSVERRGPAICNVSDIGEGKDEMTKASIDLQDLRRRIYVKAKAEPSWRFWGLYVHVCKMETLRAAYEMEANDLLSATPMGLKAAGAVPPAPSTPAERLALWCDRLPSPAPEMLRTLAAQGERYMTSTETPCRRASAVSRASV